MGFDISNIIVAGVALYVLILGGFMWLGTANRTFTGVVNRILFGLWPGEVRKTGK